jgi:hypothetical protein
LSLFVYFSDLLYFALDQQKHVAASLFSGFFIYFSMWLVNGGGYYFAKMLAFYM